MSTRTYHPLLRYLLFFALAITVALPTSALAAPARQITTEDAVLLAYYESDVVAAEDGEVVVGLSFYDDDSFEMALDYQEGETPTLVYGSYVENDDGVVLTVIGADAEVFDASAELELLWDADDTLLIPGSPDGLMGEEDIILYPTEVKVDATGDAAGDATGNITDDNLTSEVGGAYVSTIQPNDVSDGVVYILNLLPDGDASLSSDYLNLEPALFELGTWTDNGDNTVTVEIVGTQDEDYDEAILIEFSVGDNGELWAGDVPLYPLTILDYLADDSGQQIGSAESDVYVYVAEVVVPDEDEPLFVYMFLYDDGTVIMSDAEETATLYGEWTFEEEMLYVTLTHDDETEFDEPGELVFEFDDDSNLVATEYPVDVFGEEGLIFYPADDEDDEAVVEGEFYFYESDQLPSEETDGIVISVVLSADGAVMVSTDMLNDEDPFLEYGEWTRNNDGAVIITVNEGPEGVYDEPFVFTFEEDADDLSLVLVEESIEVFGEAGLVLHRIE